MYSILYREWVYTVCTKMCHCHDYMHSSVAQGSFLAERAQYIIFQNVGGKQRKLLENFQISRHSNQHISNHHNPRAHSTQHQSYILIISMHKALSLFSGILYFGPPLNCQLFCASLSLSVWEKQGTGCLLNVISIYIVKETVMKWKGNINCKLKGYHWFKSLYVECCVQYKMCRILHMVYNM
jgi:hypothetical protein